MALRAKTPDTPRAGLERELQRRNEQHADALARRDAIGLDLAAARARRDADRPAALADDDADAKQRYAQASADVRALEDAIAERDALLIQLDADRQRLTQAIATERQAEASAQLDTMAAEPERRAAELDQGLALIETAWPALRDARIAQLQLASDAGLPAERYHNFRTLERKIAWTLGCLGLMPRPSSARHTAELTCAQIERDIQRGATPTALEPHTAYDADAVMDALSIIPRRAQRA